MKNHRSFCIRRILTGITRQLTVTFLILSVFSCSLSQNNAGNVNGTTPGYVTAGEESDDADSLYSIRNGNRPYFTEEDYSYAQRYGYYVSLSEPDSYGRTGVAIGLFDYKHMPDYPREPLNTKPTGWVQKKYDTSIVPGGWLFARAHAISFQISGIQDEPRNLITGTRALNNDGMLPFENMTADHMREEREHRVLYRVTPDFRDNELLARGVLMESDCLDCDDTADYCAYVRNIQPGICIDYSTGNNWLSSEIPELPSAEVTLQNATYILNTGTRKFHMTYCSSAPQASSSRYSLTQMSYDDVVEAGYTPCGVCRPDLY